MKVYLELPVKNRGLLRVRDALVKYAPEDIEIVSSPKEADLIILHVYGRNESLTKETTEIISAGKQYAMIQYCIRSTLKPMVDDWIDLWRQAKLVWSYYDLPKLCLQDGFSINAAQSFPFYYAPLGVETNVFKPQVAWPPTTPRRFLIATNSASDLTESVRECYLAARSFNREIIHLGPPLNREGAQSIQGIDDSSWALILNDCEYVSGLRRKEGFEQPVLEGLMCGARPIVFDRPEMRHWFSDFAIFIEEAPREDVIESLKSVFSKKLNPVTEHEQTLAKIKFNWNNIIGDFYKKILS